MRKGQITMFMMIGLAVLLAFGFLMYAREEITDVPLSYEVTSDPAKATTCLSRATKNTIEFLEDDAMITADEYGVFELEEGEKFVSLEYEDITKPYGVYTLPGLCDPNGVNGIGVVSGKQFLCPAQLYAPDSESSIQSLMEIAIQEQMYDCMSEVNGSATVVLREDEIISQWDYPQVQHTEKIPLVHIFETIDRVLRAEVTQPYHIPQYTIVQNGLEVEVSYNDLQYTFAAHSGETFTVYTKQRPIYYVQRDENGVWQSIEESFSYNGEIDLDIFPKFLFLTPDDRGIVEPIVPQTGYLLTEDNDPPAKDVYEHIPAQGWVNAENRKHATFAGVEPGCNGNNAQFVLESPELDGNTQSIMLNYQTVPNPDSDHEPCLNTYPSSQINGGYYRSPETFAKPQITFTETTLNTYTATERTFELHVGNPNAHPDAHYTFYITDTFSYSDKILVEDDDEQIIMKRATYTIEHKNGASLVGNLDTTGVMVYNYNQEEDEEPLTIEIILELSEPTDEALPYKLMINTGLDIEEVTP